MENVRLSGGRKHKKDDINITQNRQLFGFLQYPTFSLRVCNLPVRCALKSFYLQLNPTHPYQTNHHMNSNNTQKKKKKIKG